MIIHEEALKIRRDRIDLSTIVIYRMPAVLHLPELCADSDLREFIANAPKDICAVGFCDTNKAYYMLNECTVYEDTSNACVTRVNHMVGIQKDMITGKLAFRKYVGIAGRDNILNALQTFINSEVLVKFLQYIPPQTYWSDVAYVREQDSIVDVGIRRPHTVRDLSDALVRFLDENQQVPDCIHAHLGHGLHWIALGKDYVTLYTRKCSSDPIVAS